MDTRRVLVSSRRAANMYRTEARVYSATVDLIVSTQGATPELDLKHVIEAYLETVQFANFKADRLEQDPREIVTIELSGIKMADVQEFLELRIDPLDFRDEECDHHKF